MADYRQPADVLTRVRFFDGQFLTDQDFVDEQLYHLDRTRRTARAIGLTGVVDGLVVSVDPKAPYRVTVGPGSAVDPLGRHLVLTAAATVTLPTDRFTGVNGVQVRVFYGETATAQAQTGGTSNRRWQETPVIAAIGGSAIAVEPPTSPTRWDDDGVLLGVVSVSGKGDVTLTPGPAPGAGLDPKGPFRGPVSVAGDLAVGTGAAWNPAGWNRVVDLFGSVHSRYLVRNATTTGYLAVHPGFDTVPGGMMLGSQSAHALTLTTSNLPRLSVTAAGQVGIGTTAPSAALHVVGTGGTTVDLVVAGRLRSAGVEGGLWFGEDRFVGGLETDKQGFFGNKAWQFVINKAGDVGVGTSTPQTNTAWSRVVDVVGSANTRLSVRSKDVTGVLGAVATGAYSAQAGLVVGSETDHAATIITNGLARLTVLGGKADAGPGRVGIGLTAPQARLHVAGTGTATGTNVDLIVDGRIRSSGTEGGLWVGTDRFVGGVAGGAGGAESMLGIYTSKGWQFGVTPNGDVSVGSLTPTVNGAWSRALDVFGSAAARVVVRAGTILGTLGAHPNGYGAKAGLLVGAESAHATSLVTNGQVRLAVSPEGQIGIGVAEADNAGGWDRVVDVVGTNHSRLLVRTSGIRAVVAAHNLSPYGAPSGMVAGTETAHPFSLFTANTSRLTVESSGDVYVHSTLWVQPKSNWGTEGKYGPSERRWYFAVGRSGWNTNDPGSGGAFLWQGREYSVSDVRLKEDLHELQDATAMISGLRGVTFRWNEEGAARHARHYEEQIGAGPDATEAEHEQVRAQLRERLLPGLRTRREVGLVAQEVEAVLPELVGTDAEGIRGVDYRKLTAVLVQAVKEQQQTIETMQRRMAALETPQEDQRA